LDISWLFQLGCSSNTDALENIPLCLDAKRVDRAMNREILISNDNFNILLTQINAHKRGMKKNPSSITTAKLTGRELSLSNHENMGIRE